MAHLYKEIKYSLDYMACIFFKPTTTLLKWYYRLRFIFIKPTSEIDKVTYSWSKNISSSCPYSWEKEYFLMDIKVYSDDHNGLKYVLHQGKKLYFKRSFSTNKVRKCYRALLIEQDPRSAHRYVSDYDQLKGKTLLDIGTAEGVFALDVIENLSSLYLFECENDWIEALNATFLPWTNKVTIVAKYVTDVSGEHSISIDDFLIGVESSNLFLKMDIEGFEGAALRGAKKVLSENENIVGSITIYHKEEDEKEFTELFRALNFNIEIQAGYFCVRKVFRRAVLRFGK